jgi:hypothetical protein
MGDVTIKSTIDKIAIQSKDTKDGHHQFMTVVLAVDEPTEGQVGGMAGIEKKGLEVCVAIDSTVMNAAIGKITIGSKKIDDDEGPIQVMKIPITVRGPDNDMITAVANAERDGVVSATRIATVQLEIAGTEAPAKKAKK